MNKNITLIDDNYEFSAHGIDENGFHFSLSAYISEERTDVAGAFVDVKTANHIIAMLQEAVEHSERMSAYVLRQNQNQ